MKGSQRQNASHSQYRYQQTMCKVSSIKDVHKRVGGVWPMRTHVFSVNFARKRPNFVDAGGGEVKIEENFADVL